MELPAYNDPSYPPLPPVPVPDTTPGYLGPEARMPRDEAEALTKRLKRGAVWCSLAAFLALIGLVAQHVTGVTAAQASPSTGGGSNSQTPSDQQGGGFFGNQPGNGSFGSGGSSQSPISGTSVS